jgi:hypothetical protein
MSTKEINHALIKLVHSKQVVCMAPPWLHSKFAELCNDSDPELFSKEEIHQLVFYFVTGLKPKNPAASDYPGFRIADILQVRNFRVRTIQMVGTNVMTVSQDTADALETLRAYMLWSEMSVIDVDCSSAVVSWESRIPKSETGFLDYANKYP